uniref:YTH domain-containing family protein n=1 Tax=Anthurium amnicola TaxID=1678845 RepID=A0A1D1XNY6_9ARAE
MYNGSEHMTETYMIPGTSSNQQLVLAPTFPEIGSMGSEMTPEVIVDQGLYYSAAAPSYYTYLCTGFESPGESDDRHRFFGLDGQDLHCPDMQTESLPYVYYAPSYGYAHSPYNPYNPYNPYIPGAVIGVDSPFVGTQQYIPDVAYQQPVSSPAYFPVVPSGADVIPNISPEPLVLNAVGSGPGVAETNFVKFASPTPMVVASSMLQSDPVTSAPVLLHSQNQLLPSEASKRSLVDVPHTQLPASDGAIASGGVPRVNQLQFRDPTGSGGASDQLKAENVSSIPSSSKVTVLKYNGSTDFEPNRHGPPTLDGVRPRLPFSGMLNNGNVSPNMLGEQNRGPRTGRSRGPWAPFVVKSYTSKAGAFNAQGNITIHPDQYNREDFPVNYPDAKFFVIKSYSEDDVHKSIKYNVWSSTPSGNKRLDSAYEDAQRISGGDTRKCPVFLLFSVNASGQFCGVAEMIGPVDFNRDMDFWQQDKWSGSFPVKWHIIKDVPNTSFRHIILENNENKPVTNSRDTQEVKYMPGMSMLTIFKNSPLKTSILDDFMYYEQRQKIMHEEKSRLLGRGYDSPLFVPVFVPPNRSGVTIKHPLKAEVEQTDLHDNAKTDVAVSLEFKVNPKLELTDEAIDKRPTLPEVAQVADASSSVMKIGSLSLDSGGATNRTIERDEYVTVGSMSVKVNGYVDSSLGTLTVGSAPVHPKTAEEKCPSGSGSNASP